MEESNFLTIDEMAETLKVPKSWLYSRTRETGQGTIPRIKGIFSTNRGFICN